MAAVIRLVHNANALMVIQEQIAHYLCVHLAQHGLIMLLQLMLHIRAKSVPIWEYVTDYLVDVFAV